MKSSLPIVLFTLLLTGACEQADTTKKTPAAVLEDTTGAGPKAKEAGAVPGENPTQEAAEDRPEVCASAVGLRSKCEKKQAERKAGCGSKPEAERSMCEHDADLLMKACQDLPEVAEDLFCAAGSDANCTKRAVRASDRVAGKACAGGQVCTAPGFVCDAGTLWDCVCGNVYYPRSGNCGCECVD